MVMHRDLTLWSNLKSSTLEVPSGGWRGDCGTRRGTQTGNDAAGAFSNLLQIKSCPRSGQICPTLGSLPYQIFGRKNVVNWSQPRESAIFCNPNLSKGKILF